MTNTLYTGDNLYILNGMNGNSVDLIYLDPPFNSKRTYSAAVVRKPRYSSMIVNDIKRTMKKISNEL